MCAGDAIHQGDFALLFMANGMCHDTQSRIAAAAEFIIGHLYGAGVVDGHELDKQPIEFGRRSLVELLKLHSIEQAGHGCPFLRRADPHRELNQLVQRWSRIRFSPF